MAKPSITTGPTTPKPKVMIATMVWDAVPVEFLLDWSLLWASCFESDWDAKLYMSIGSSCLLPLARNRACISAFRDFPDFTHLLMVDSDVLGLRADEVQRMVEHDVPIVAALVTRPRDPYGPACEEEDGFAAIHDEMKKDSPGLVKRKWVGTGCVLIRRDVLEATAITVEKYQGAAGTFWFRQGRDERIGWDRDMQQHIVEVTRRTAEIVAESYDESADSQTWLKVVAAKLPELHMESFLMGRGCWDGGTTVGEDIEFGQRAGALGFQSYVDCGIALQHVALRGYGIDDHLRSGGFEVKTKTVRGELVNTDPIQFEDKITPIRS